MSTVARGGETLGIGICSDALLYATDIANGGMGVGPVYSDGGHRSRTPGKPPRVRSGNPSNGTVECLIRRHLSTFLVGRRSLWDELGSSLHVPSFERPVNASTELLHAVFPVRDLASMLPTQFHAANGAVRVAGAPREPIVKR
jgi:hypothetical protein